MKKFSKTLISALFVAILTFSLTACSFVNTNGSASGNRLPSGALQSVNIKTSATDAERVELSLPEAVAKAERTSVALQVGSSAGAGVVIDASYDESDNNSVYIVTCHHVVSGKGDITVLFPDENCRYDNADYIFTGTIGGSFSSNEGKAVTLIGGDADSDIAVLKVDLSVAASSGKNLSSDKIVKAALPPEGYSVKKGETVFAIGNPTGTLPGSVCTGIVSYLERETSVEDIGKMRLMQIDVTTNPGNSGGGLYNLYGELIGITNAGNTDYEAINFAIPMSLAVEEDEIDNGFVNIVGQLMGTYNVDSNSGNYGYVYGRKSKFGFTTTAKKGYIQVSAVTDGSIAKQSGIQVDDVVNSVKVLRGETVIISKDNVTELEDFSSAVAKAAIGDTIVVKIMREVNRFPSSRTEEKEITMVAEQFLFCDTRIK